MNTHPLTPQDYLLHAWIILLNKNISFSLDLQRKKRGQQNKKSTRKEEEITFALMPPIVKETNSRAA